MNPHLILDYPYHGVDFRGDPDIGLPPGATWGRSGICFLVLYSYTYVFFHVFMIYDDIDTMICLLADAGL